MSTALRLELPKLPPEAEALRAEVRAFVSAERAAGHLKRPDRIGLVFSPEWSRKLAARGWIGMTWPKAYGGRERSFLERYVLTEELLVAGVPLWAHWVADRQSGPVLLRFGSEEQKQFFLPRITRGECYFCIGLSEPDAGSDLAGIRSRAEKVEGGWRLNGRKIWTTNAHRAHYMLATVRTGKDTEDRHAGFSQLIIDLSAPGVTRTPIQNMTGEQDFNEVLFEDVFVPDGHLIGEAGNGWNQASTELAYERSGPERWISTFVLLSELVGTLGKSASDTAIVEIGRLFSHLLTLRQMSIAVASMLQKGLTPNVEAAIVKDSGTRFEQEIVRVVRNIMLADGVGEDTRAKALHTLLWHAQLSAPCFTIRGGTGEILRGIIARGLGLR